MRKKDVEYLKKYLPTEKQEEGIKLLKKGISPQYIVGNVDFYGNIIEVNKNVLIPRFETELLVEKTIMYIQKLFPKDKISNLKILDIGTGSGCIAITLKKELNSQITGIDISNQALKVAKKNLNNNQVEVTLYQSDVFSKVTGKFDIIISNPPYIRYDEEIEEVVKDNEPHLALYAEENGLYFYKKILNQANFYLENKFLIAFEIGEKQGEDVKNLAYQYLKNIEVKIEKDYSNRNRFVFIMKKD
ncbi:MAG: peptide chain release factor N(5)-glutamine methyltransferase [Erysipelotrichaceae bacterium]|nr:peptide chain release factor N(5)-glutamine methyltransferase [Erysipelotrichaceae bacterium]